MEQSTSPVTKLDPVTILQDARSKLLDEKWNANAYWVLCAAIGHLIGAPRISTVNRVPVGE